MVRTLISEILAKIFINCDKDTLNNCRIVCKQWNAIINQAGFWKQYYYWNYSRIKSLNKLIDRLPNHTYANLCKFKLEDKEHLINNIEAEEKKSFPIFNLNENNIRLTGVNALKIKHEVCIKTDCMAWINKENNTINYLEYNNPQRILNFQVEQNPLRKVSIVDNLIVGITESHNYIGGFTIHIFSIDEKHKDLHLKLFVGPEIENGKLNYVDGIIENNLIIIAVTLETMNQQPYFVPGQGWVTSEGEYTIMVWDLNKLIVALNQNEKDEYILYERIHNVKIPGLFNTEYINSCAFEKKNEKTDKLEKHYYIICNGDSGKATKIAILDENLRVEDTKVYENDYSDTRNSFKWSYICPDGIIIIYCERSLVITSVENFDKQIRIPFNRRFTVLNIMHTSDILYVIYRHYALAREVITLAIIDIVDIKNALREISSNHSNGIDGSAIDISDIPSLKDKTTMKQIKLFEYDFGNLVYNKFLDTGLIHYNSKTNDIVFCPFSKIFCN